MSNRQRLPPAIALIVDEAFKKELAHQLALLAREIQARDKCSDQEAIDRAMKEYDRLALEATKRRNDHRDAQERKRAEDALREQGKPTLKVSLGDIPGLAALRDKLPKGPR